MLAGLFFLGSESAPILDFVSWEIATYPINHGVGEHDEPSVPGAGLELAGGLGASDTTSRVLSSNTNADLPWKSQVSH